MVWQDPLTASGMYAGYCVILYNIKALQYFIVNVLQFFAINFMLQLKLPEHYCKKLHHFLQ